LIIFLIASAGHEIKHGLGLGLGLVSRLGPKAIIRLIIRLIIRPKTTKQTIRPKQALLVTSKLVATMADVIIKLMLRHMHMYTLY